MTNFGRGYLLGLAALGSMLGLIAVDIQELETWSQATTPAFIGSSLAHIGVVIGAFIGGRLVPSEDK